MGANSPTLHFHSPDPKKKNHFPLIIAAAAILIVCALKWRDVVIYVDGEAQLTAKYRKELQNHLDEADEAEQYALIALSDGWYTCVHSGFGTYFLKAGEVWKYGTTTKGEQGRYDYKFLRGNGVNYIVQFRGTLHECLKEEKKKIYMYPLLPENLARVEELRLIRPPYNPIRR
ncbi:MAG TPA: hypothetical protein PLO67_18240 [Saprospiraceae bacterium]|nr:hypothetical protein [Saprospiraceae bacterium]